MQEKEHPMLGWYWRWFIWFPLLILITIFAMCPALLAGL